MTEGAKTRRRKGNRAVRREARRNARRARSDALRSGRVTPHQRWRLEREAIEDAAKQVGDDPQARAKLARIRAAHRSRRP